MSSQSQQSLFPKPGKSEWKNRKSVQEQIDKFTIIQSGSAYPRSPIIHYIHYFIKAERHPRHRSPPTQECYLPQPGSIRSEWAGQGFLSGRSSLSHRAGTGTEKPVLVDSLNQPQGKMTSGETSLTPLVVGRPSPSFLRPTRFHELLRARGDDVFSDIPVIGRRPRRSATFLNQAPYGRSGRGRDSSPGDPPSRTRGTGTEKPVLVDSLNQPQDDKLTQTVSTELKWMQQYAAAPPEGAERRLKE
ncbi:hypothetical protein G5714_007486 [Onychostoma macrolepis]|uniref:Uncharacterized protein n=1 Tax=Onychostoma macrolepis TaxID=369639 RepID=A0A7J6D0G1_9TELE|nr:hypothetical protein G5714_007486 [Onychostoma macrolepis]